MTDQDCLVLFGICLGLWALLKGLAWRLKRARRWWDEEERPRTEGRRLRAARHALAAGLKNSGQVR